MLRAIIVDDEELAIERLKKILIESGEVEILHTFLHPSEAYEFVRDNRIDVAFLDISMPEINGIKLTGLLHQLDAALEVVFTTGYNDYAVRAFDMNALDYLLKPVTTQRMAQTLDKIRKNRHKSSIGPSVEVFLFNGIKTLRRDQLEMPLKLRTPKTEELFVFLVCKRTVSREEIVDTFWSRLDPEKAGKNLNSTLYYIRQAIGKSSMGDLLVVGKNEIQIDENNIYCDLYEFEQLLKQIRSAPERRTALFKRVEALYTGPFLKGKAYDWATDKLQQIEQSYIELLEVAARSCLKQNQPKQALHYFGEILKIDALREDISYEVIRLYIELGRMNEAFRQYLALEKLLKQELGTVPNPSSVYWSHFFASWNDTIIEEK